MKHTTCWATLAMAALLPSGASGAALLTEGFDDISTLVGSGWALTSNSNPLGSTGWFQGNPSLFSAFSGLPDSYIAANFNNASIPGNISNWLITPQLSFSGLVEISFTPAPKLDRLSRTTWSST